MALLAGLLTTGGILLAASPASAAVTCTAHKGKTRGWINCTGGGTVRLVIDCKAPQATDFVSQWFFYNGSFKTGGECKFGINEVRFEGR